MKRIISMIVIITSSLSLAYADELKNFNEIFSSIEAGKNIKMVINFDNCSPKPPIANIQVYTTPTAVMIRKNYLQFANSPLTTNNPLHLKKPVLENCTYKINDNNEVNILTRVITLPEYKVSEEMSSTCQLGTGVKVFN